MKISLLNCLLQSCAILTFAASCAPNARAQTNLLTVNPSFEATDANFSARNGAYSLPGWNGNNASYNGHFAPTGSVEAGTTTQGTRAFHITWGGQIATAPDARAVAQPNTLYEMRYDLRTLVGKFPEERLGTYSYLEFFDDKGELLKAAWGPEWMPQSQSQGVAPWETITVRGLAPANTARVGVRIAAPRGGYSKPVNKEDNRDVEIDNVRLFERKETTDQIAIRRAPRLVEPGKSAALKVWAGATQNRVLSARLVDARGAVVASASAPVGAGRELVTLPVEMPAKLANGAYRWELGLVPAKADWKGALGVQTVAGVVCDQSVDLPTAGLTAIGADNARLIYMGRWDDRDPQKRWMGWFGSQVTVRFSGTSLAFVGGCGGNGYGGPKPSELTVVIDGDIANARVVNVDQQDGSFSLASGLGEGIHTAQLFKGNESDTQIRFEKFVFEAGHGLLRAEPLPARKLQIFGDSVTSGGSATPTYLAYAPTLARELDADTHITSKGGTGVASSFGKQAFLLDYWDNWTFPNTFDASTGVKWDTSKWQPDAILSMIGHNDQFNGGAEIFTDKYAEFHQKLRAAYPNARIVIGNTIISAPVAMLERAAMPLAQSDPKTSFVMQLKSENDPKTGHPTTSGHQAMARGDAQRFSYADVLEQKMGWGLPLPATSAAAAPLSSKN